MKISENVIKNLSWDIKEIFFKSALGYEVIGTPDTVSSVADIVEPNTPSNR